MYGSGAVGVRILMLPAGSWRIRNKKSRFCKRLFY
jgi:hypothetical protein